VGRLWRVVCLCEELSGGYAEEIKELVLEGIRF